MRRFLISGALAGTASIGLISCGGSSDAEPEGNALSACTAFAGRTIEGAVISSARIVAGTADVPEYCAVRGEMQKDLDFEVRLPTDWNKRTVFTGGGGFDGVIRPTATDISKRGYASISTNHGHTSAPSSGFSLELDWAVDQEMLADYAYQSVPRVMAAAKVILKERYGEGFSSTKIVYEGCSGGGRQALMQAQRYPDLFDGVISRAPANSFNHHFLHYWWLGKQLAEPGGQLSPAKMKLVGDAVLAKCDAQDGLADGVVSKPQACVFDPSELACQGAEASSCLTATEVRAAKNFYAPLNLLNGRYTWPGFPVGGEEKGWSQLVGATPLAARGYMSAMVARDPSVDFKLVDPAQYEARISQLKSMIDAVDPDLSRFKASGGKLILWTGLSDWLITANNATEYYQSVVQANGGQAATNDFVEYYTSPGVGHCSGGAGASDKVDLLGPMFEWLEKDTKPSANLIVAGQSTVPAGMPERFRPVCKYPDYPRYVSGDPNAAASFACTSP